jgi:putative ABC transport system permease protein
MIPMARRMVARDRVRFSVSVAGAGFTTLLLLFLLGTYEGVQREANGYVSTRPADVWVCQSNSNNLMRSTSLVGAAVGEEIGRLDGVAGITPLLRTIATARIRDRSVTFFILGIDPDSDASAPVIIAGSGRLQPGEIILDRALAAKHGIRPGDSIQVQDRTFRVAGISSGTNAVLTQFAFATLEDAASLLGLAGVVSFWLVSSGEGESAGALAQTIRDRFPGLNAFTRDEFVRNNLDEMRTGLLPILATLATLGFMTGGAVLTLLLYGGVLERRPDYALLKAIGASHRFLVLVVARQSLLAVMGGLVFGTLAYALAAPLLRRLVPETALAISPTIAATVGLTALLMGLIGSWLAIRKLRWIYPGEVFRA